MKRLKVLVLFECSGVVRDAFAQAGHYAISVDYKPTESTLPERVRLPSGGRVQHLQMDVFEVLRRGFAYKPNLLIAHPECTYLTVSAEWAYKEPPYHQKVKPETLVGQARVAAREAALEDVRTVLAADCDHIALENPIGVIGTRIRKANQIIHPHQFGHDASKATCLWLENLPELQPTEQVEGRIVIGKNGKPVRRWANQTDSGQNHLPPSDDRAAKRAQTYPGIADAMVKQWVPYIRACLNEQV